MVVIRHCQSLPGEGKKHPSLLSWIRRLEVEAGVDGAVRESSKKNFADLSLTMSEAFVNVQRFFGWPPVVILAAYSNWILDTLGPPAAHSRGPSLAVP